MTGSEFSSGSELAPGAVAPVRRLRLAVGFGRGASVRAEAQILVALAVLVVVFSVEFPAAFATWSNLDNMTRQAAILLVVALAQMFALVVGGFDLSVGANMGFTSTVCALVMSGGGGVAEAVVVGLVVATAIGLVNGVVIAALGVSPFVATLGMLTFLGGYANSLADGGSISGMPLGFSYLGGGDWGPIPAALGIAVVAVLVVWVVQARMRAGLYIFAIGGGREASRLAGVSVVRYEILAYTLCGSLAGLAGVMLASRIGVGQAALGQGYELLSIAAAVIGGVAIGGGMGRIVGVVLGVALFTVLTTGLDIAAVNEFTQQMIIGAVLVAAVLLARLQGPRRLSARWRSRSRTPSAGDSTLDVRAERS